MYSMQYDCWFESFEKKSFQIQSIENVLVKNDHFQSGCSFFHSFVVDSTSFKTSNNLKYQK